MSEAVPEFAIAECGTPDALEFAAYAWPLSAGGHAGWPVAPGAVQCDAARMPVLLHHAPGRWLAPAPDGSQCARFVAAAASGAGTLVEVSGKWTVIDVSGPGAARLLACAVDIDAVLDRRDCAAVTLFDCPSIVARTATGFRLWVQSSYAAHFLATAAQCAETLRRVPKR